MFPKTLANNIAFMFTNVTSALHWNSSGETIPDSLKDAPQFALNNPIALQKKYLKLREDPNLKRESADFRKVVKAGERDALKTLADLLDWLGSLEPQPTARAVPLYGEPQNIRNTAALMDRAAARNAKTPVSFSPLLRLCLQPHSR